MPANPSTPPATKPILIASAILFIVCTVALLIYRGPSPVGLNGPDERPSAVRMKQNLVELIGTPAVPHPAGTEAGEAFLSRLESKLDALGVRHQRINLPWEPREVPDRFKSRVQGIAKDAEMKNLWVTIPGREPDLSPILIATHHDSCVWGPGAGDAGSSLVAQLEYIRILSGNPPRRTTHFLFTDGEEGGLLGANAIARMSPLPFPDPLFVMNFDARGTQGGVPMFETHQGNGPWVQHLIENLARPKITSSLAVTVYRTLPNATDFNVWHGTLGWSGFNYATIGGAHHYHQPSDTPEHLSLRTLQHFGDHLVSMHSAVDDLSREQAEKLSSQTSDNKQENAIFFDLLGWTVVSFSEGIQVVLALLAPLLIGVAVWRTGPGWSTWSIARHALSVASILVVACLLGFCIQQFFRTTPWWNLLYTPIDYPTGLVTVGISFVVATLGLERAWLRRGAQDWECLRDWTWLVMALLGLAMSIAVPGGAYLLVLPTFTYAIVRLGAANPRIAAWAGWIVLAVLAGPLLGLLVQALGPWKQSLYAVVAALLATIALTAWMPAARPIADDSNGLDGKRLSG